MTEEIQTEHNETPEKICKFCGKEGNKAHERFCSSNPDNVRSKKKLAMKQDTPLPAEPAHPLVISDVQPYIGNHVAWFEGTEGKFYIEPDYIGSVNNIPNVLVQFQDGAIIPPGLIPGFIGMLPMDSEFPEEKKEEVEPFPSAPEDEIKPAPKPQEKKVLPPVIKKAEVPVKKHWWQKTPKAKTPEKDRTALKTLIEDAINATGQTK